MEGGRDRRLAYIQVRASTGSPSWACVGHWNAAPKCKSSVCSVLSLFCVPVRLQAPSGSSSWECWPSLEASSPPSPTGEHLPEISRTADGQAGRREASRLFPGSPAAVAPPPPPPPPPVQRVWRHDHLPVCQRHRFRREDHCEWVSSRGGAQGGGAGAGGGWPLPPPLPLAPLRPARRSPTRSFTPHTVGRQAPPSLITAHCHDPHRRVPPLP